MNCWNCGRFMKKVGPPVETPQGPVLIQYWECKHDFADYGSWEWA